MFDLFCGIWRAPFAQATPSLAEALGECAFRNQASAPSAIFVSDLAPIRR